jgi:hypothetical protein
MSSGSPADKIPLANEFPHPAPPEPGSQPVNKFFDRFLVVLFCLTIIVPLVGLGREWDQSTKDTEKAENRKLAKLPEMPKRPRNPKDSVRYWRELTKVPEGFFDYFKDNFGFRPTLIRRFQDFRFQTGLLTHNQKVLLGKENWLFMSHRPGMGFERELGFKLMTEEQLNGWREGVEQRTRFLAARGIPYLLVIAPEKQSIYPEMMPAGLEGRHWKPGEYPYGPIDQFLDHLKERKSAVNVLDLRPALRAYKKAHPKDLLYFKGDTHWNDLGAYVGYEQIVAQTQKLVRQFKFEPQPRTNFREIHTTRVCDLVPMLGLQNQLEEPIVVFGRIPEYPMTPEIGMGTERQWKWGGVKSIEDPFATSPTTQEAGGGGKPRLLMPRDSFSNSLFQMVGPHFDRPCFWFQDRLDLQMLEKVKPHIVIHEIVERKLYVSILWNQPEVVNMEGAAATGPAGATAPAK